MTKKPNPAFAYGRKLAQQTLRMRRRPAWKKQARLAVIAARHRMMLQTEDSTAVATEERIEIAPPARLTNDEAAAIDALAEDLEKP